MDKKIVIISSIIFLLLVLSFSLSNLQNSDEIEKQEECIKYGSIQHKVAYASDYYLAKKIIYSDNELGYYFDYNFCQNQ